jgi:hypothetical protein
LFPGASTACKREALRQEGDAGAPDDVANDARQCKLGGAFIGCAEARVTTAGRPKGHTLYEIRQGGPQRTL